MKKGVFKFALRNLRNNKLYFVITAFLLVFCFVLFAVCEFLYVRVDYNRYVADRVLAKGIENTGLVGLDNYDSDSLINFRVEAYKKGIVDSIGNSCVYCVDWRCVDELIKIQNGSSKLNSPDYDNQSLGYVCVDSTLMNLCDLKLQDGYMINRDNFDYEDQNLVAMYLGDLFSDIPIGTEYKLKLSETRVITIRVMGIIEKGEEWIGESIGDFQGSIVKSSYNLDNEVIMAFNDGVNDGGMMFFSTKEGNTMEETQKALYELADKYDLDIIAGEVSARFDGIAVQYGDLRERLFTLMVFIVIISTMIIICFNAVSILSRKKQYGVLIANGVSMGRLFLSIFLEQVIKAITGLLLAGLFIYAGVPILFGETNEIMAAYDIFLNFVLWKTILFCFIECVVISGVGSFILGRYKPIQLIKYQN